MNRIEIDVQTGESRLVDLTPEEIAALPAPQPRIPQSVTKRQATQVLILNGLDEQVEALLAGMPGVQGKLARAEWKESNTVERNRPLVIQMLAALGKTPEEGDQLFIQAEGL